MAVKNSLPSRFTTVHSNIESCYGWYSNRKRGDRKKQEERERGEGDSEAAEDARIIDIRNYKPKRIPQLMWRECIKKILSHLNLYEEQGNQRAPPIPKEDYTERV